MEQYSVSQCDRFAFFKRELALFGRLGPREIFLTEWVRSKQAVGADVPSRLWVETFWMTHDCDADGFAFDRTGVVDPSGRQTPGIRVLLAVTIHNVATLFGIHSHR